MLAAAVLAGSTMLTPIAADAAGARAGAATTTAGVRIDDRRLDEVSGIAPLDPAGSVVLVHNDSGDAADGNGFGRFFAVDARTGRTRAVYVVSGAPLVDCEDIAVSTNAAGQREVWLADTGDNSGVRSEVRVYRVPAPPLPEYAGASAAAPILHTAPAQVWRVRYPDGRHDAEALAVDPRQHRAYLVTKSITGRSQVFALPADPDPGRVQQLRPAGQLRVELTGTAGGPVPGVSQLTVTGAAVSADGRVLAVRTYTDAYLWKLDAHGVANALARRPVRVALPNQHQGEGIAVVGDALWLTTEGAGSRIATVRLPAAFRAAPSSSAPPARTSAARAATSGSPAPGTPRRHRTVTSTVTGGVLLVVIAALAWFTTWGLRRRRERQRGERQRGSHPDRREP